MIEAGASFGKQIAEKAIKVTIAVVGLLVLRLIFSALPMLRHPILYLSPESSEIGSSISANMDVNGLLQAEQSLKSLPPAEMQQLQQAFGAITASQGQDYEKAYDQIAGMNADLGRAMANVLTRMRVAILPITIANAIIDTLIFVVLLLFGRDLGLIMRSSTRRLPQAGPMLNLAVAAIVAALAYHSYKGILYPFLLPDNVDFYGWIFLALGLAPLVGIGVLIARNMDTITTAVMQVGSSGGATAAMRPRGAVEASMDGASCPKCGYGIAAGAKFCPNCAAPVSGVGKRFCGSCGAENSVGAKFCGGCGQALTD